MLTQYTQAEHSVDVVSIRHTFHTHGVCTCDLLVCTLEPSACSEGMENVAFHALKSIQFCSLKNNQINNRAK